MPKITIYTRSRIESLYNQGSRPVKIFKELKEEGLKVSFASVTRIIKKDSRDWIHKEPPQNWKASETFGGSKNFRRTSDEKEQ